MVFPNSRSFVCAFDKVQAVNQSFNIILYMQNPFGNIAPKNPNWDLKRDVQKRIDKLEKRTQKALAEIACKCSNMINRQIIYLFSIWLYCVIYFSLVD